MKHINLSNIRRFYMKCDIDILHECFYRHKIEIANAINSKDYRLTYVYKKHLEAVKQVLLIKTGKGK